MDSQLLLFCRQYLQLFEPNFLAWPPKQLLKNADAQAWLYNHLFNGERNSRLPPETYQIRVLKPLMAKIEQSIEDPEEDKNSVSFSDFRAAVQEISDDLMSHLSHLMAIELPAEVTAVQQKAYVTFTCLPPSAAHAALPEDEAAITLLERRHLISGSLTTGYRTWEAALHLGAYLLTPEAKAIVEGRNVIELGAGTGFVSILCAKILGAKHVTATDGDEGVVETIRENLFLNGLDNDDKVVSSVLRWGHGLRSTWVEDECDVWPYDVVLGADITYDKTAISALVATFRFLFDLRPTLRIIVSGAVRNVETYEFFRHACLRSNLTIQELAFEAKPMREQMALFYATAVPLKIVSIARPDI